MVRRLAAAAAALVVLAGCGAVQVQTHSGGCGGLLQGQPGATVPANQVSNGPCPTGGR